MFYTWWLFCFKKNLDQTGINNAKTKLDTLVTEYNNILAKNKTLGKNSPNEIKNSITVKTIQIENMTALGR